MAKKQKRGRPPGRKETTVIQARVERWLYDALTQLADRNHRSKNAELVVALEGHAQASGFSRPQAE